RRAVVSRRVALHPLRLVHRVPLGKSGPHPQHHGAHGQVTMGTSVDRATADTPRGAPDSIAHRRTVTQPPEVRMRANAEHWTASLYLRDLSPYLTWVLLRTSISANGVTGLMILVGWATAAALLIPGVTGAALALVLGQLQMLVDCCD